MLLAFACALNAGVGVKVPASRRVSDEASASTSRCMNVANGTYAALSDRGWLSLTFKTTF